MSNNCLNDVSIAQASTKVNMTNRRSSTQGRARSGLIEQPGLRAGSPYLGRSWGPTSERASS